MNFNELGNSDYIADMMGRTADMNYEAAEIALRPSTIYKPHLSIDGDQWCALYGDNLHDGVAGFGKSPALAFADFDRAWSEQRGGANNE